LIAGFELRPAEEADIHDLASVRHNAIVKLAVSAMSESRAIGWADSGDERRVARAIDEHEVWVAVDGKRCVGWVEIAGDRIEGLYVCPDLAQQGIGSSLMQYAEKRIGSAGFGTARLDASPNAEGFYRRRGYEAKPPASDAGLPMRKRLARETE
jgi:putative acetyltransferase